MVDENDDYIYDEVTGEWRPASEMAAVAETGPSWRAMPPAMCLPTGTRWS